MKIAYVVNARIPTEKAHGYQIMRTCLEWKAAGVDIALYVPRRSNHIAEDAFSFYGLEKSFEIVSVPCAEWVRFSKILGPLAFYLQSLSFTKALAKSCAIAKDALIYSRNPEIVSHFSKRGYACFYNAHNWPASDVLIKRLLKGVKGVVCNSQGTAAAVAEATSKPTVVVHNAADENAFKSIPKIQLRKELGLPTDKKIVTYVGHLYGWKGTDMIIPLGRMFRDDSGVEFEVVGGTPTDIERFSADLSRSGLGNVKLLGFKKKALVPKFLAASDVLLLPNSASTEESMRYTSPIKLFEYMASGAPIVASDLPSIRAILPEQAGSFAKAGDADSFAVAIRRVLSSADLARGLAARALAESERYSWPRQARVALDFIQSL